MPYLIPKWLALFTFPLVKLMLWSNGHSFWRFGLGFSKSLNYIEEDTTTVTVTTTCCICYYYCCCCCCCCCKRDWHVKAKHMKNACSTFLCPGFKRFWNNQMGTMGISPTHKLFFTKIFFIEWGWLADGRTDGRAVGCIQRSTFNDQHRSERDRIFVFK